MTLDFGSQFANYYRRRIDSACEEILDSLEKDDERVLDRAQADLQDALYEMNREVRLQYDDEEDDDFFGAIRKTFLGDDDQLTLDEDYSYNPRQQNYGGGYSGYDNYYGQQDRNLSEQRYSRSAQNNGGYQDDYRRDYGAASRGNNRDNYQNGFDDRSNSRNERDNYDRDQRNYGNNRDLGGSQNNYGEVRRRNVSGYSGNMPNASRRDSDQSPYGNPNENVNRRYYSDRSKSSIPYQNDWDEEDDEWF